MSIQPHLCKRRPADRELKGSLPMTDIIDHLPPVLRPQSERILADIHASGSTIDAVKNGAQANGFVLGLQCCGGIDAQQAEALSVFYDKVVECRLKRLTLGLS
jgi:hypothetical protein